MSVAKEIILQRRKIMNVRQTLQEPYTPALAKAPASHMDICDDTQFGSTIYISWMLWQIILISAALVPLFLRNWDRVWIEKKWLTFSYTYSLLRRQVNFSLANITGSYMYIIQKWTALSMLLIDIEICKFGLPKNMSLFFSKQTLVQSICMPELAKHHMDEFQILVAHMCSRSTLAKISKEKFLQSMQKNVQCKSHMKLQKNSYSALSENIIT